MFFRLSSETRREIGVHGWRYAAVNTGNLTIRTNGGLGVPWGTRDGSLHGEDQRFSF